jgi:hypothetical protein
MQGVARQGKVKQGKARQGKTWLEMKRCGYSRQLVARDDKAIKARQCMSRQSKAIQGKAKQGIRKARRD